MPQITLNHTNTTIKDTYINQAYPSQANYTTVNLFVGGGGSSNSINRLLMKFDLGLIPNNAIINSATLTLYSPSIKGGTVNVHTITNDWSDNVTWGTSPSFDSVIGSAKTISTNGSILFDVKNIVQQWVNGTPNFGFLLKDSNEADLYGYNQFASNDNGTPANRPQLIIDYTIPSTGKKQVEYVGSGTVANSASSTSLSIPIPVTAQTGDILVASVVYERTQVVTVPSGWVVYADQIVNSGSRHIVAAKMKAADESTPTFTSGTASQWSGLIQVLRNVKSINAYGSYARWGTNTTYPPPTSVTVDNTMFLLLNTNDTGNTFSPPLNYSEGADVSGTYRQFENSYKYMYKNRSQTTSDMTSTTSGMSGLSAVLALEPITNNVPTLTLTSPADNLLGTDGNCEDTSKFSVASVSVTLDSVEERYGNYALKLTSTSAAATLVRTGKYTVDNTKHYILIAEARNISMSFVSMRAEKGSDNSTIKSTGNYSGTSWGALYVKLSPTDLTGETSVRIGLVGIASASGQQWLIDGIRLYMITQEEYDKIGVYPLYSESELLKRFPYMDTANNQTISEGQSILKFDKSDFSFKILADDADVSDTLEYTVLLRNVTRTPYTSCSKGVEFLYTIPFSELLLGNNLVTVKVRDNNGAETVRNFTVRNKIPQTLSNNSVKDVLNAMGYSTSGSTSLIQLKPSGYNGNLSYSDIINYLT